MHQNPNFLGKGSGDTLQNALSSAFDVDDMEINQDDSVAVIQLPVDNNTSTDAVVDIQLASDVDNNFPVNQAATVEIVDVQQMPMTDNGVEEAAEEKVDVDADVEGQAVVDVEMEAVETAQIPVTQDVEDQNKDTVTVRLHLQGVSEKLLSRKCVLIDFLNFSLPGYRAKLKSPRIHNDNIYFQFHIKDSNWQVHYNV